MHFDLIIFDLDDTLLDTSGMLIPIANTPLFEQRIRQSLPLLPGARENLESLKALSRLWLLTQGRELFQRQKIQSLGIEKDFEKIVILDPQKKVTKPEQFLLWQEQGVFKEINFLSIGNRRRTDLQPAKLVGGHTCWFRYGEHEFEDCEGPGSEPDLEVRNHAELRESLGL